MRVFKKMLRALTCCLAAGLLALPGSAALGASSVYYTASEAASPSSYGPSLRLTELPTRLDNLDQEPDFAGGEVRFLANTATRQQQLCGVIRSPEGKVLVVDGGVAADAEHLISVLQSYGGVVDAWLITHPQDDHIGALYEILERHPDAVDIRNVYFHFHDYDWYGEAAPAEQEMVWNLLRALEKLPADRLHGFSDQAFRKGQTVTLSASLSFRALNDPLDIRGAYAVNNSSIMYDITLSGKHILVLGDMGPDGGDQLLPEILLSRLQADYVVMSHHGQNGVKDSFYLTLAPEACIWSCPDWLFDAAPGNRDGLKTYETKSLINSMGITRNYCTKDGDILLR